jgi:uncharacterized protein (DUF1501 family)
MAITRRQFLKRTGVAAAGGVLGPSLFRNMLVQQALASTIGDRYLVVIFLDGGNDGLNTVTPVTNGGGTLRTDYDTARGNINLSPGDLAATLIGNDPNSGAQLAIHPGFVGTGAGIGGLKALWDEGKLAVIQGCGYPDYTLSHEEARIIWETGNPLDVGAFAGTGWVGRFLAHPTQYSGADIPGVAISDRVAGELRQNSTSVLAVRRLRDFGFPYHDFSEDDIAFKRAAFEALYSQAAASAPATLSYIGNSGAATLLSAESYPLLHDLYEDERPTESQWYDDIGRGLARDFKEVAKVIYGVASGQPNVNARFFQVNNGGYDTHSDQGGATGQHHDLHKEVGDSVRVFLEDLKTMPGNVADKTTVVIWSEFSRRIKQNGNGTDHGSQGPMFVVGGSVVGGVYGNHPNIAPAAQDDQGNSVYTQSANPFRSTDFRDVYGTILKRWLNMPEGTILSSVLPADAGNPTDYWTSPNFDLGFL